MNFRALSDSRAFTTVCRVTWIAVLITEVGHLNGICHRRLFARLMRKKYSAISAVENGSYSFSRQNRCMIS